MYCPGITNQKVSFLLRPALASLFSVCAILGAGLALPVQAVAVEESTLALAEMTSTMVPAPVPYAVLTPPAYNDSEQSYPLLLWLHGGGGNRDSLVNQQPWFDTAWQTETAPAMVVVTPSAGRSFYMDYRNGAERWESFLLQELLPAMQTQYRIDPERIYIGGISMGGMGSLRMAFKYPDRFRGVIALEPGIEPALAFDDIKLEDKFWRADAIFEERYGSPVDAAYWADNNPATIAQLNPQRLIDSGLAIYIEAGTEDMYGLHRGTDFLHRILFDTGVKHEYRYVLGADHVGATIRPRVMNALDFMQRVEAPLVADPVADAARQRIDLQKRRAGL